MSNIKYFVLGGQNKPAKLPGEPDGVRAQSVWMDGKAVPGCMLGDACWYTGDFEAKDGLMKHESDEVLLFVGGDLNNTESLNATVELWIENDKLSLTDTCAVFVPAGCAHGKLAIKGLTKPLFCFSCQMNSDSLQAVPAEAAAPEGTYAANHVERYERPDPPRTQPPPGFLRRVIYLCGSRIAGAPYIESVWMCTTNDTGPAAHEHDFDELVGFFGTDPENPEELGAEVHFVVEDEDIAVTKSCLVYIPRGVRHSPITVPKMDRPVLHLTGGNGGEYVRAGEK